MVIKNPEGRVWSGFIWLRMETSVCSCEHGNGTMGSIRCEEFLDWFNNYEVPKNDFAP
jgi:hypothetical protein